MLIIISGNDEDGCAGWLVPWLPYNNDNDDNDNTDKMAMMMIIMVNNTDNDEDGCAGWLVAILAGRGGLMVSCRGLKPEKRIKETPARRTITSFSYS